jgi:hypothetical protein
MGPESLPRISNSGSPRVLRAPVVVHETDQGSRAPKIMAFLQNKPFCIDMPTLPCRPRRGVTTGTGSEAPQNYTPGIKR